MREIENTNLPVEKYRGSAHFEDFPYQDLTEFDRRIFSYIAEYFSETPYPSPIELDDSVVEVIDICDICFYEELNSTGTELRHWNEIVSIPVGGTNYYFERWKEVMGEWHDFTEETFKIKICTNCKCWFIVENM